MLQVSINATKKKMVGKLLYMYSYLKQYEKSVINMCGSNSLHVPTFSLGSVSGEIGLISIFIV